MNLRTFDLNLLRVLNVLLADPSTVRAGQTLGMSQPAVSSALKRLRDSLGDPLFVRQGQRLVATEFARSLEMPVQALLDEIEVVLTGPAQFDPTTSEARFCIASKDFFAEMLMPDLAQRFSDIAPHVLVQLIDSGNPGDLGDLVGGTVDLTITLRQQIPPWASSQDLFRSGFVMLARRGHARLTRAGIGAGDVVPLDLFCDLKHVVFSLDGKIGGVTDAALRAVGRTRRIVMAMPVFSGVYNAVAQSDFVGILPESLARKVAPRLDLMILRPPVPVPQVDLMMIWHRRQDRNPAHQWFRSEVADVLEQLDQDMGRAVAV